MSTEAFRHRRIVITGGSGFIGSLLVPALARAGCDEIVSMSRTDVQASATTTSVICDLVHDSNKARDLLKSGDIVVHLAWAGVSKPMDEDGGVSEENLRMARNLLSACAAKNVRKVVFLSSGGTVYGDWKREPFKETDRCEPRSAYGRAKLAVESLVIAEGERAGFETVCIRLSNLYGRRVDGSKARFAVDAFIANAKRGVASTVNGDGSAVRDYIHIDDMLSFVVKAVMDDSISGIYNLGTGVGTSLTEVLSLIAEASGKAPLATYAAKKSGDLEYNVLDIARARQTGWSPKWDLRQGIRTLWNDATIVPSRI